MVIFKILYDLLKPNLKKIKYKSISENFRRNKNKDLVEFFSYYAVNKKKFWNQDEKIIVKYEKNFTEINDYLQKLSKTELNMIKIISKQKLLEKIKKDN